MLGRQAGLYEDELTVYRCLRVVNTGQWLDVLFTSSSEVFEIPELSHRTDLANALGLAPGALEALDTSADEGLGSVVAVPTSPDGSPISLATRTTPGAVNLRGCREEGSPCFDDAALAGVPASSGKN